MEIAAVITFGAAIGFLQLAPEVVNIVGQLRSAGETFARITAELEECRLVLDQLSTELYHQSVDEADDHDSDWFFTFLHQPNGPIEELNGLVQELRRRVASQNSENQASSQAKYQPQDIDHLCKRIRSVKSVLGLLISDHGR